MKENPAASLPPNPSSTPGSRTDLPEHQDGIGEETEMCAVQDLQNVVIKSFQTMGGI